MNSFFWGQIPRLSARVIVTGPRCKTLGAFFHSIAKWSCALKFGKNGILGVDSGIKCSTSSVRQLNKLVVL